MPEQNPRRKNSSLISMIIGILLVAGLAAGGYYLWKVASAPIEPAPAATTTTQEQQPPASAQQTFASSTMKITASYPREFSADSDYAYTAFKGKPVYGVQFVVPASMVAGTNLAADSGVSIEQLPRANSCTGDIYLLANVKAQPLTDTGVMYSVASSTETKGGDRYEEVVYAIPTSSPCTAIRYSIHTTAAGTSTQNVREFDRSALLATFDEIRRSLVLQ